MLEIKVNGKVYQVEIKVNKYGAVLEIRKNFGSEMWYQDIFDVYSINGSFNDYITNVIQQQEQALKG